MTAAALPLQPEAIASVPHFTFNSEDHASFLRSIRVNGEFTQREWYVVDHGSNRTLNLAYPGCVVARMWDMP